jgi:hypothetical protein
MNDVPPESSEDVMDDDMSIEVVPPEMEGDDSCFSDKA